LPDINEIISAGQTDKSMVARLLSVQILTDAP